MQPHRWHHLVKPRRMFDVEMPSPGSISVADKKARRIPGMRIVMRHAGFYEDRDVQGTFVHWEWLLAKWTAVANKLEGEERRGVYGPSNR